jgi:hypothetical protein
MSQNPSSAVDVMGIDIVKNSFHVVGLDRRGAIVPRQNWSRGQVEARLAKMPPCLIGMEACVGAHHLSRKLKAFGHEARLMPAKYVRPYSKGQKNDFRDAEAVAEAVLRPTMKFATKTVKQLDLQALHHLHERLVSSAPASSIRFVHSSCSAALQCDRCNGSCEQSCHAFWQHHPMCCHPGWCGSLRGSLPTEERVTAHDRRERSRTRGQYGGQAISALRAHGGEPDCPRDRRIVAAETLKTPGGEFRAEHATTLTSWRDLQDRQG